MMWESAPIARFAVPLRLLVPGKASAAAVGLARAPPPLVLAEAAPAAVLALAPPPLVLTPQSLHGLLRRWCSQRLLPPQSLHVLLRRWRRLSFGVCFKKRSLLLSPTVPFKNFSSLHSMCMKFSNLTFPLNNTLFPPEKCLKSRFGDFEELNEVLVIIDPFRSIFSFGKKSQSI